MLFRTSVVAAAAASRRLRPRALAAALATSLACCAVAADPRAAAAQADNSVVPRAFVVEYAQRYGGIYRLTPEQRETVRERATAAWRQMTAQERAQFVQRVLGERERQRDAELQRRDSMGEDERTRMRDLDRERADARRREMLPPGGALSRSVPGDDQSLPVE